MGKRRSINTYKSVSRKILEGYGRGEGVSYKSWLTGHEFASNGMYIRLMGRTIPRIYRFMSKLEADAFVIYDSMSDVSDILEQYYLTLEETLEIADELRIRHPYSGKYYNPVTTDLLIHKGVQVHGGDVGADKLPGRAQHVVEQMPGAAHFGQLIQILDADHFRPSVSRTCA